MLRKYKITKLPKVGAKKVLYYPSRPKRLLKKAKKLASTDVNMVPHVGIAMSTNRAYINWLKRQSMLEAANKQAPHYSGKSKLWQKPYGNPKPRSAIKQGSVWYTAYPVSLITKPGKSMISGLADEKLWDIFQEIGIRGLHTGPMKQAGGIKGWKFTPSVDGHFDRISNRIDPIFGNEKDFIKLTQMASRHNGIVIDDIIPGHTGKGADFRLAEMAVGEYPGIYHMIEIEEQDWHLLPVIPKGKDSINISQKTEDKLKKAGYIIGKLQRVLFYEPGIKDTNWSATKEIKGADGLPRRWVYLHYWKEGQPTINWLDPSFAGMKLVIGDALHSIDYLGSNGLRLDANGLLGQEISEYEGVSAWSEGHPLSEAANHLIAGMVRKVGGFTFQELNLTLQDTKTSSKGGADLSYDFVNRPAYHHAIVTQDTEFLRLMMRLSLEYEIDPASLVHALQNHDELTLEMPHLMNSPDEVKYFYKGEDLTGPKLKKIIRKDLLNGTTKTRDQYNLPYSSDGISCTTASLISASLDFTREEATKRENTEKIKNAHLLLCMYNAFQPGVFALSGWDISGSMTLDKSEIEDLVGSGDTRWINRGAYDHLGNNPSANQSEAGMPKGVALYPTLNEQMNDPNSFAKRLQKMLAVREKYKIATAKQIDIPDVSHSQILVMVHVLPDSKLVQATVLNFSDKLTQANVTSEHFEPGYSVIDMFGDEIVGEIDNLHSFITTLGEFEGKSFIIKR